jgi:hypothetical protein
MSQMTTPRPKSLTTIAILLAVLALLGAVTFAFSFATLRNFRNPSGNFTPGQNFTPGGNFTPGQGVPGGNFQGTRNFGGGNGTFRAAGGGAGLFNLFRVQRAIGLTGTTAIVVRSVLAVAGIALALVCAWFVLKQKRWALNLAMILAVVILLSTLPGLFLGGGLGFGNLIGVARTGVNALRMLAALPIIVLGMLPSVRDYVS